MNGRRHFGHFGLYRPGLAFFARIACEQYGHANRTEIPLRNRQTLLYSAGTSLTRKKVDLCQAIAFVIIFARASSTAGEGGGVFILERRKVSTKTELAFGCVGG
jgi:hypothetical protein